MVLAIKITAAVPRTSDRPRPASRNPCERLESWSIWSPSVVTRWKVGIACNRNWTSRQLLMSLSLIRIEDGMVAGSTAETKSGRSANSCLNSR
jgi:hypothetical protein